MRKYIDADIIRNHFKADLSRRPKSFLDDMLMACVNRVIDEAPAADVAEVVRCKDCKWFGDIGCAIRIVDDSDRPSENDFCSFAERKDNG